MAELPETAAEKVRVFLSHSAVDAPQAYKLRKLMLESGNFKVFAAEDLSAGEKWETRLRLELATADVVVALLTISSVSSGWQLHEIGAAWALNKLIIPVMTSREVLNDMPESLAGAEGVHVPDADSPEDGDKFLGAVRSTLTAAQIS